MYRHLLAFSNTSKHQRDADSEPRAIFFLQLTNHSEVRFFSAFRVRGSSPPGMPSADSRWRGWGGGSFFPTIFSRQISKLLSKFVVLQKYPNRSYDVLYAYVFIAQQFFLSDKWQQHFGTFWGLIWIGGTHEWHVWVLSRPFIRWLLIVYVIATVAPF